MSKEDIDEIQKLIENLGKTIKQNSVKNQMKGEQGNFNFDGTEESFSENKYKGKRKRSPNKPKEVSQNQTKLNTSSRASDILREIREKIQDEQEKDKNRKNELDKKNQEAIKNKRTQLSKKTKP